MDNTDSGFRLTSPRLMFPLVGFFQGLGLYLANEAEHLWTATVLWERLPKGTADAYTLGLNIALVLAVWLALLAWRTDRTREVVTWGLGSGVGLSGFSIWLALRHGKFFAETGAYVVAAGIILTVVIFATLDRHLAYEDGERQDLTRIAVALKKLAIGWAFAGILYLVLMLWVALFNLIGIDFFEALFEEELFLFPVMFAAAALGIAVVDDLPGLISVVGWLFAALVKLLAPILAAAVLIFVVALPFVGLDTLWDTGHATVLLLSIQLIALAFAHLLAEGSARGEGLPTPLNRLLALELVLLPVLGAFALYALYLRFQQYGLTAERVVALLLAIVATLFSFWAAISVLIGRLDWTAALSRANLPSLGLIGMLALLFLTPVLDPWRLSAEQQYARLSTGQVTADKFDFGYLKYRAGKQGEAFLAKIRNDPRLSADTGIRERLALLDKSTNYYMWQRSMKTGKVLAERLGDPKIYLRLRPADLILPPALETLLFKQFAFQMESCAEHKGCYLLELNMDDDADSEFILVVGNRKPLTLFEETDDGWIDFPSYSSFDKNTMTAISAGNYRPVPPLHRDLEIEGRRFIFQQP